MEQPILIFATNNQHKVDEIKNIAGGCFNIITMKDAGIDMDIPEPHATIPENPSEKSTTVHKLTKQNCFSEDTGLEVFALNGEPGVKSARYAGDAKDFQANIDKLMKNLQGTANRAARFRTIISLVWHNTEYIFEGVCNGTIATGQKGTQGFGYDAVFMPDGSDKTFGEMSMEEKNIYSHRRKATDQLMAFLQKHQ